MGRHLNRFGNVRVGYGIRFPQSSLAFRKWKRVFAKFRGFSQRASGFRKAVWFFAKGIDSSQSSSVFHEGSRGVAKFPSFPQTASGFRKVLWILANRMSLLPRNFPLDFSGAAVPAAGKHA